MTRPTASPAEFPYRHRIVAETDNAKIAWLLKKIQRGGNKRYWQRKLEAFLKEIGR